MVGASRLDELEVVWRACRYHCQARSRVRILVDGLKLKESGIIDLQLRKLDGDCAHCGATSEDQDWERLCRRIGWQGQLEPLVDTLAVADCGYTETDGVLEGHLVRDLYGETSPGNDLKVVSIDFNHATARMMESWN